MTNSGILDLAQLTRLQHRDLSLANSELRLQGDGLGSPGAWFLGPKAENKDLLVELITNAIAEHCDFRATYHPDDPTMIDDAVKASAPYKAAVELLRREAAILNKALKRSAPIFSMRSHGHMLWDQVLPAMVGYFSGMLYNQNNVAAEASPLTTWLEIEVGNDLCRMLGYRVREVGAPNTSDPISAWGHITCDGTVANIEALWSARNAKFLAVAVKAALIEVPLLRPARALTVRRLDGSEARLIDLSTWTLVNLKLDDVLTLTESVAKLCDCSLGDVIAALQPFLVSDIGLVDFYHRFMTDTPSAPVVFVPSTRHYSWPKAGTLLGIGQNNIRKVHVDLRARMKVGPLVAQLNDCLQRRIPVLAVVAVIGTTEESAVDPLVDILRVREDFRRKGLDFAIHCDAAWGGYFNCMFRDDDKLAPQASAAPEFPMSDYVRDQYAALSGADSITVDPHKAGFVPYPAGGLCYRNSAQRDLVSLKAPVVYHSQSEPTVGIYGIEGSKPGASAASVYLAHKVIRPTKKGYGKILGQCVWTSKRMYCRLLTMADRDQEPTASYKIAFLQMLPAERDGLGPEAIERQRKMIAGFVDLSNADLLARLEADPEAMALFQEIGSDQVILSYAFNFRDPATNEWNTDPELCNALNNRIFEICSITDCKEDPRDIDLILTSSAFDVDSYGSDFVNTFGRRLGLSNPDGVSLGFLISTTMNPWTTDTPDGDFLRVIEDTLAASVKQAIGDILAADRSGGPAALLRSYQCPIDEPQTTKTVAPFGSWPSPITAETLVQSSIRLGDVRCDGNDIYWLEGRPSQKGRSVIVRRDAATGAVADVTPQDETGAPAFDVRSDVYSYGGGAWLVDHGIAYFSNGVDGRLYRQKVGGSEKPEALTASGPSAGPHTLYADGVVDRLNNRWIGVQEDWSAVSAEATNLADRQPRHRVIAIALDGTAPVDAVTLAEGHDFYSSPKVSPDGKFLAYLAWDHPNMPWQGTNLYVARLDGSGMPLPHPTLIAGGPDESIYQPEWSPEGDLWFVSDKTGWWNLYRCQPDGSQKQPMAQRQAEFGEPQWNLGMSSYCFAGSVVVAISSERGLSSLLRIDPAAGAVTTQATGYTSFSSLRSASDGTIVFIAGASDQPVSVVKIDPASTAPTVLRRATELALDPVIQAHVSRAEPVTFPTGDGAIAHGLYYAPTNPNFSGPANERPPLIVMCHGGPTAQASSALKLGIQYWTSRGHAVLDVNYRGSSGFGRAYRDSLREQWGVFDVEDCINGARALAQRGLADKERTVITGGSAGGYTTLAALTFHDYFKAGASHYGIGDLEILARDTHKFEARYLDWLVGPYPQEIDRYRKRSPLNHVDRLTRPVIFFQGSEDKVVPPNQAELMVDALRKKGLPVGYLLFEGERHGFRQADNIRRAIEAEHYFFSFQVFRSCLQFGGKAPLPAAAAKIDTQIREVAPAMSTVVTAQNYSLRASDHDHPHDPAPGVIANPREFHAFALLGREQLFASHLTMLHMEPHMYQFIISLSLPEPWRSAYQRIRNAHPKDSFFIANTLADEAVGNPVTDPMTVPELQSGLRKCFVGNVFQGIPPRDAYTHWPWAGVKPVLSNIPVSVERIVHFRPFSDTAAFPTTPTYLLFGAGSEAHMVYMQTRQPDFDHVVTLTAAPDWLAPDLLQAGAIVDLAEVPLRPAEPGSVVHCRNPVANGRPLNVRYRAMGTPRRVNVDHSPWFCTKIVNHPDPCASEDCDCASPTPSTFVSTN